MPVAIPIAIAASAAAGIGGAALQSNAAGKAAQTQAQAADAASQRTAQAAQNSLELQQEQLGITGANEAPYINAGAGALGALTNGLGITPAATNPALQGSINQANNIAAQNPNGIGINPAAAPPSNGLAPGQIGQALNVQGVGPDSGIPQGTSNQLAANNQGLQNNVRRVIPGQAATIGSLQGSTTGLPATIGQQPAGSNSGVLPSRNVGIDSLASSAPRLAGAPQPVGNGLNALAGRTAGGLGAAGTVGNAAGVDANGTPLNTQGNLNASSLNEQWATPFSAPTAAEAAATPGEQFEREMGNNAIQNSAAAQGNLLSGSTLKGLDAFNTNLASTNYQQAYNNALGQYQQNYNIFNQNQGNAFNRLASIAGLGQTSVGQLASAGSNAAQVGSNTLLGAANSIGQSQQNAAAATASGYVGGANALAGGINSAAGSLSSLGYLQALQNQGQAQPISEGMPIAG